MQMPAVMLASGKPWEMPPAPWVWMVLSRIYSTVAGVAIVMAWISLCAASLPAASISQAALRASSRSCSSATETLPSSRESRLGRRGAVRQGPCPGGEELEDVGRRAWTGGIEGNHRRLRGGRCCHHCRPRQRSGRGRRTARCVQLSSRTSPGGRSEGRGIRTLVRARRNVPRSVAAGCDRPRRHPHLHRPGRRLADRHKCLHLQVAADRDSFRVRHGSRRVGGLSAQGRAVDGRARRRLAAKQPAKLARR